MPVSPNHVLAAPLAVCIYIRVSWCAQRGAIAAEGVHLFGKPCREGRRTADVFAPGNGCGGAARAALNLMTVLLD